MEEEEEELDILQLLKKQVKAQEIAIVTKRARIKNLKEAKEELNRKNIEYNELLASYQKLERMYTATKNELHIKRNHFNQKEISILFGMSISTLTNYRTRTVKNLPYHQYESNGNIYFILEEVEAWLEKEDIGRN